MVENATHYLYKIVLIFLLLFSFFTITKPILAVVCSPGQVPSGCTSLCNGKCQGVCFWDTIKKDYFPYGCNTDPNFPEYLECKETITYLDPQCYWNSDCMETYCGSPSCQTWSGWSPCGSNCYSWRYCRDTGNDQAESRWCCSNTPPPGNTPPPPILSCDVNLPDNLSLYLGYSNSVEAQTDNVVGLISRINFSTDDPGRASINPETDEESPYLVSVTGESVGTTTVTANVIISGSSICSDTMNVTVTPPGPWWQVQDADIYSNGNLTSLISYSCTLPVCNPVFELNGPGGFPGIPIASGEITIGDFANISSTNWNALTSIGLRKNYSYSFFERLISSDTQFTNLSSTLVEGEIFSSPTLLSKGAYWFKYDGATSGQDLTINSGINVGSNKVILFVDNANLFVNGGILLDDGKGFFMAIVGKNAEGEKGSIFISSDVSGTFQYFPEFDYFPEIEGIFFADGQIDTGVGTEQIHLRGSFVAMDGVNLQRNLTDNSITPSEFIEFGPDLLFTMPNELKSTTINWTEIQP